MPINWNKILSDIDNFLRDGAKDGNVFRTPEETADFIATTYYNAVMSGGKESFGNGVTSINKNALKQTLLSAFKSDFNKSDGGPDSVNSMGTSGVIGVWSGGVMQTDSPPPNGVNPVSNMVTFPGTYSNMSVNNSTDTSNVPLAVEIVNSLKNHAQTIQGINEWKTSESVPVIGNWVSIS